MLNKKTLMLLMIPLIGAMLMAAPPTATENCQHGKKVCNKMEMKECCMIQQLPGLNAEQKEKIGKIHDEMLKMMAEMHAGMQKQHAEMKALMKKGDLKTIEARIDEAGKLRIQMQKKMAAHRLAVRALLTDEQKVKFDEMPCCGMKAGQCGTHAEKAHDCQKKAKETVKTKEKKNSGCTGDHDNCDIPCALNTKK